MIKLKLTSKLTLVFVSFAAVLLIGVESIGFYHAQSALKDATIQELEATAGEKEASIHAWIDAKQVGIAALSTTPSLIRAVSALVHAQTGSPDRHIFQNQLAAEFKPRVVSGEFLDLFLLDPRTGRVILGVEPGREGQFKADRAYFLEGRRGPYTTPIYFSPELQIPTMLASAPIFDEGGNLLAVLAGRLNLEQLNAIVQWRTELHETDDAFLVNSSRFVVTQPRFIDDPAVLRRAISTVSVNLCVQKKRGTVFADDYRQVPVIASYRWMNEHQMCLIVKISQAEALGVTRDIGSSLVWAGLVILGMASAVSFALSSTIVRPIRLMQVAAQRFGRGDLNMRLPETRTDELGVLAREFNSMAASLAEKELELQNHAHTLEQKVQERTRALQWAEETGQVGSWVLYAPEERLEASDGLYRLMGLSPQDHPSITDFFQRIHPEDRERVQRKIKDALRDNSLFDTDFRIVRTDGQIRILFTRGESRQDGQGNLLRLSGVTIDISERKEIESALAASEKRFRSWIEHSSDILSVVDASGIIQYQSPSIKRLLGYEPEELLAKNAFEHVHPEDRDRLLGLFAANIQDPNAIVSAEYRFLHKDGSWRILEANGHVFVDEHDELVALIHARDITERKQTEMQLADALEFTSHILTAAPVGIFTYRLSGECLSVNAAAAQMVGGTVEQLEAQNFHKLESWKRSGLYDLALQAITSSQLTKGDVHVLTTFGKDAWYSAQLVTFQSGTEDLLLMIFKDITERRWVEQALREREEMLNRTQSISHVGSWELDLLQNQLTWSEEVYRIFGLRPQEFMPTYEGVLARIHPEDRALVDTSFSRSIQEGQGTYEVEHRIVRRDNGETRFLHEKCEHRRDASGQIIRSVGMVQDITERKQAERALWEKEHLLSEAQRMGHIGSWSYDLLHDRLTFSDEMYRLLDILPEDFQHNSSQFLALVYPSDRPVAAKWLADIREGMQAKDLNFRLFHKNGELCYLYCTGAAECDEAGRPVRFIGITQDVTERRAAEMQINQQIRRLTALREIDRAIVSSPGPGYTLGVILSHVISQLQVDAADVLLYTPEVDAFTFAAGQGFRTKQMEEARFRLGESHAKRAAKERRTIRIPDLRETTNEQTFSALVTEEGFVSYMVVPLMVKGTVKGVLEVYQRSLLQPYQDWLDFFHSLAGQAAIAIENTSLLTTLQSTNQELVQAYDATIEGWSRAMDLRDREFAGHTHRATELALNLARAMGMDPACLNQLRRGALLHDVGKLGVPDHILFKPAPLTSEERQIMEKHPDYAYEMLAPIPYLKPALNIPYFHHEKWDGTGYPLGLKGEQIPLEARIFAVVNVWDALLSDRPYRTAWCREDALAYIRSQSGVHFDPQVVECFLAMLSKIE